MGRVRFWGAEPRGKRAGELSTQRSRLDSLQMVSRAMRVNLEKRTPVLADPWDVDAGLRVNANWRE
jgi:hypothetical protein